MTPMSGGQAAVEALRAEKTSHVFGLIGSATMEMFDALYDAKDIRFIGVHDERTGTHMADGFARASGKAGVILAGQNGPGATNLVTGLAQAMAAFSPVVSIAGALSSGHVYRDAFQEVDQQALFTPVTKKTWTAPSANRVPELVREAFRGAMSPRRGPVQLNLPRDVLAAQAEFPAMQSPDVYRNHSVPAAGSDQIDRAAKLLAGAVHPVIIAGGGIKNTRGDEAGACVWPKRSTAPLSPAPGHGDAVPFGHPLNAGQMGPRGNAGRLSSGAGGRRDPGAGHAAGLQLHLLHLRQHQPRREDHPGRAGADRHWPVLPGRARHLVRRANPGGAADRRHRQDQGPRAGRRPGPSGFQAERRGVSRPRGTRMRSRPTRPSPRACSRRCAACCPRMRRSQWTPGRCVCKPPTR